MSLYVGKQETAQPQLCILHLSFPFCTPGLVLSSCREQEICQLEEAV